MASLSSNARTSTTQSAGRGKLVQHGLALHAVALAEPEGADRLARRVERPPRDSREVVLACACFPSDHLLQVAHTPRGLSSVQEVCSSPVVNLHLRHGHLDASIYLAQRGGVLAERVQRPGHDAGLGEALCALASCGGAPQIRRSMCMVVASIDARI